MARCPEGVCSRFERILQRTHGYIVEAVPPRDARFARVNTGPQRGSTSNGGRIGPAMAHGNRANENVIEGALRQNFCRAEAPAVGALATGPRNATRQVTSATPARGGAGQCGNDGYWGKGVSGCGCVRHLSAGWLHELRPRR